MEKRIFNKEQGVNKFFNPPKSQVSSYHRESVFHQQLVHNQELDFFLNKFQQILQQAS